MRLRFGLALAAAGAVLLSSPASAMHWSIYAPDDAGNRYWIDRDTIEKKDDSYTYFVWLMLDEAAPQPESAGGNQSAINCATGDSLKFADGNWVAGPHFTDAAYLFKFVCQR